MATERICFYDDEYFRRDESVTPRGDIGTLADSSFISQSSANWPVQFLGATLGIVYVWFEALKILGISPVSKLVGKMSIGMPRGLFVRFIGIWEVVVGVAFLFRLAPHLTLPLFCLQVAGTFLTFVFHPQEAYRKGNPLLLTQIGEFIVKNLVLLAAGLVIGISVRKKPDQVWRPTVGPD